MLDDIGIATKVAALRVLSADRDSNMHRVQLVRQGKIGQVYPEFFPEGIDQSVVANFVDIVARDLSEVIAPLPAINCSAVNQASDTARTFADNRTRIATNYFRHSDLQVQMYSGADMYVTHGFLPIVVELDWEAKLPIIRIENPMGAYPEYDRYGRCTAFAKVYESTLAEMIAKYPDFRDVILGPSGTRQNMNGMIEVIRYYDKDQIVIYMPSRNNTILSRVKNPLGKMLVVCPRRPSPDEKIHGQFDDVLGIQMLRNRFALLAMEAAEKAVQAPIVVPNDLAEFALGGDSVLRTDNPAGVRRVELPLPAGAFAEQDLLNAELRVGARYPESRTGNVKASIVTGAGVEALLGAFDTQIKSAQAIFTSALRQVIGIAFELDEKVFDVSKTIRGVDSGSPFALTYKPSKGIKGDYSADVRYGMLAGLNPAQGLIFLLQAMGGGLISKDTSMRELPFSINVTVEQERIEVENMRAKFIAGLDGYMQAIPQMAMQGQDPSQIIQRVAKIIELRQKGNQIESAVEEAFKPVPPTPEELAAQEQQQMAQQQGGAPAGAQGVTPQGRPDMQTLLSSLGASGQEGGSARISRRNPVA